MQKSTTSAQTSTPRRRRAVQARSLETVERILTAVGDLIAELGPDAVTMTEIARRAGVAMGSLYQYFPDRAGVMAALFSQHALLVRARLVIALDQPASLDDLVDRVRGLAKYYFQLHREDPLVRGLWAVVQTDPNLQALDVADSLENARIVFSAARPFYGAIDEARLMTACALCMQLAAPAARFAMAISEPMKTLSANVYADMAVSYLLELGKAVETTKDS